MIEAFKIEKKRKTILRTRQKEKKQTERKKGKKKENDNGSEIMQSYFLLKATQAGMKRKKKLFYSFSLSLIAMIHIDSH